MENTRTILSTTSLLLVKPRTRIVSPCMVNAASPTLPVNQQSKSALLCPCLYRLCFRFVLFSVGQEFSFGGLTNAAEVPFHWKETTGVSDAMKAATERIIRDTVASGEDVLSRLMERMGTEFGGRWMVLGASRVR